MKRSDVVLIRPAYSLSIYKVYGKLPKHREIRPPLGLMYLASSLERKGLQVSIIDAEVDLLGNDEILRMVREASPEYVGITSTTPEFHKVKELFEAIKQARPGIITIGGGAHFSAVQHPGDGAYDAIDHIVAGEGEKGLLKIVTRETKDKVVDIPNDEPLDTLPFPARHLVDYSRYQFPMPGKGMIRMDTVVTSRGCPFSCMFCFNRNTKVRYRDIRECVREIILSHERYNTRFFMFLDDTFTVSKQRVFELCDEIIKHNLHKKVAFYANARADRVDFDMLKKMKAAGIIEMSMGVESGNQGILDAVSKGTKLEQYRQVYSWMRKLGLETRGSFILGHPYETRKTIQDTIDFAKKLELVRVSCCIMTPYPGTEVYKMAKRGEGIHLLSNNWSDFTRYGRSVVRTDELSKEDLENYQKLFFMEFYTQSKVVLYHFLQLLRGNFSVYYYRPVLFALLRRLRSIFKLKR